MKILSSIVLTAGLVFGSVANASILVWLAPGNQAANTGDDVSLTLMVSGLGDGVADSLGGFDLDVNYDSSALSLDSYSLFDGLGDGGLGETLDFSLGDDGFGTIGLTLISLLFDFELDALQSDSFALAEFFFSVDSLESGESTDLSLTSYDFTDAFGESLEVNLGDNAVILADDLAVPAPATPLLLGLALLGLFVRKTKFN